jgi:DNA helicase-2/ATP-dependent DNA helicase PcrA
MLFILRTPETYVSNSIFTDSYVDLEEMVKRAGSLSTKNSLNILNNHFKVLKKLPPFAFLNYVINIVGIKNNFYEKAASKTKAGVDGIFHELIDKSKGMKALKELSDFLSLDDTVSLYHCKVKVLTFHASKGLEFDTVILPDVNEGRIPSRAFLSLDNNDEERRLFYVAMTRAKENLHIFAVKKEGSASVLPSRFITGFLDKYHK